MGIEGIANEIEMPFGEIVLAYLMRLETEASYRTRSIRSTTRSVFKTLDREMSNLADRSILP
jgi:hypothetical protein